MSNFTATDVIGTKIADGIMRAAVEIIHARKLTPDIDALVIAMRENAKASLDEIWADLKDAMFMGDAMMNAVLSAACTEVAIKSLKQIGAL